MTILPPCPYEGCMSDSDHHWHDESPEPRICYSPSTCQDAAPDYRCYSRPRSLRYTATKAEGGATRIIWEERPTPPPLMLSLPTVAKLVEAARAEGYAAGSAQPESEEE